MTNGTYNVPAEYKGVELTYEIAKITYSSSFSSDRAHGLSTGGGLSPSVSWSGNNIVITGATSSAKSADEGYAEVYWCRAQISASVTVYLDVYISN